MTLKQVFIVNLKEFRKKEGFSQMKLAECCDTTTSYIGNIETGRKFPSMELIEKMAETLKIEPFNFFVNRTAQNSSPEIINTYPRLPESMKKEINSQVDTSIKELLKEILDRY